MVAALKALWKAVLGLLRQRGSLDWDVNRAVNGAVRETLHGAVGWAVIWAEDDAMRWAVSGAMLDAVTDAVNGAVDWSVWMAVEEAMVRAVYGDGTVHPALEDFLRSVDA